MVKGIQVLGIIVGIYLFFQTIMYLKRRPYSIKRIIPYIMLWISLIIIFINPSLAEITYPILMTQDKMTTAYVISTLLIFIMYSELWYKIMKIEKKTNDLIQFMSIHNYFNSDDLIRSILKEDNMND